MLKYVPQLVSNTISHKKRLTKLHVEMAVTGGLQCMAQLIKFDQELYGASSDLQRITMRRYACMTLTNLTFGDSANKVGSVSNLANATACVPG